MADDNTKFPTKGMNTTNPFSYDSLRKDLNKTRDETVFWSDSETILNVDSDMDTVLRTTIGQIQDEISHMSADTMQAKILSQNTADKVDEYNERIKGMEEHALNSPIIGEFDGSWASTENVRDVEERLYDAEVKIEELDRSFGGLSNLNDLKQATTDAREAKEELQEVIEYVESDMHTMLDTSKNVNDAKVDMEGKTHETLQGRLIEDFRRINDLIDDTNYQEREGHLIHEVNTTLGGYTKDLTLIGTSHENLIQGISKPEEELPYGAGTTSKDITLSNTTEDGIVRINSIKGQTYHNMLDSTSKEQVRIAYSPDRSTEYTIEDAVPGQLIQVESIEGASFQNLISDAQPAVMELDYDGELLPVVPPRGNVSQYDNIDEGYAQVSTIAGNTYKNYAQGTSSDFTTTSYVPQDGTSASIANPIDSSVIIESIQGRTIENLALGEMYAEHNVSIGSDSPIENLVIEDEGEEVLVSSIEGKTYQNILTGFDTSPLLHGDNFLLKHSENSEGIQERTGDYHHMVLKGNTLKNVSTGRGETPVVHHDSCNTTNGGSEYKDIVKDDCDVHEFTINGQTVQNLFDEIGETELLSSDKQEILARTGITGEVILYNHVDNSKWEANALYEGKVNDDGSITLKGGTDVPATDVRISGSNMRKRLEPNKVYTMYYTVVSSTNAATVTCNDYSGTGVSSMYGENGLFRLTDLTVGRHYCQFKTLSTLTEGGIQAYSVARIDNSISEAYITLRDVVIVEGDYTNVDLPYFDDTYVYKPDTMENLIGEVETNFSESLWDEDDDNYILNLPTDGVNGSQPMLSFRLKRMLPANKQYTLFINMTEYVEGVLHINLRNINNTKDSSNQYSFGKLGLQKILFTTTDTTARLRMFNRNLVNNNYKISKNIILLEGDYTNVDIDIPFFTHTLNKVIIKDQEPIHHGYLYGRTLKNLKLPNSYPTISTIGASATVLSKDTQSTSISINRDLDSYNMFGYIFVNMLKPSTKYIAKCNYFNSTGVKSTYLTLKHATEQISYHTNLISHGENLFTFTTNANIDTSASYRLIFEVNNATKSYTAGDTITFGNVILLEYQEGMENWDIPYFEGMKSVTDPTITMTDGTNTSKLTLNDGTGNPVVLRSLPNGVVDQLDITTGTLIRNVGEVVLDGTQTLYIGTIGDTYSYFYHNLSSVMNTISDIIHVADSIVSYNSYSSSLEGSWIQQHASDPMFCFKLPNSKLTTLDISGVESYLQSNPITVQYQLANPTISKVALLNEGSTTLNGKVKLPSGLCDTYDLSTLTYTQNLKTITINGSEGWLIGTVKEKTQVFELRMPDMRSTIDADFISTCPNMPVEISDGADVERMTVINGRGSLWIAIDKSRLTEVSVNGLTQWLSENPFEITYQLATPIVTESQILSRVADKLEPNPLLAYEEGILKLSSTTNIQPVLDYTLPSLNSYSMRRFISGNTYTLVCNGKNTICGTTIDGKGEFTIPSDMNPNGCLVLGLPQEKMMCFDKDYGYSYGDYIDSSLHCNGVSKEVVTIRSIGKNLVNPNLLIPWNNGGHIQIDGYIPVKPNTTYRPNKEMGIVGFYDKNMIKIGDQASPEIRSFTTPNNCYFIWMRTWNDYSLDEYKNTFQLEEGSTSTSYEEYKESVTKVILDKPLRRINDEYKDTLTFTNGKLVHTQNIGSVYASHSLFSSLGSGVHGWGNGNVYSLTTYAGYNGLIPNPLDQYDSHSLSSDYGYRKVNMANNNFGFGVHNCLYTYFKVSKTLLPSNIRIDGINTAVISRAYFQDNTNIEILYQLQDPISTEYELSTNIKQYKNGHIIVEGLNHDTSIDVVYDSAYSHKISHLTPGEYTFLYNANTQVYELTEEDIRIGYKETDLNYDKPVILEGNHQGKYIPYFTGLLSCEAPIVRSVGKNLFDNNKWDIYNDTYCNKYYGLVRYIDGISNKNLNLFMKGAKYHPSLQSNVRVNTEIYISENIFKYTSFNTSKDGRIAPINPTKYKGATDSALIKTGREGYVNISDIQIELGNKPTSYAPYVESKLALPENIALRSLPDGTCDEYDVRTRTYTQKVGYSKITGDLISGHFVKSSIDNTTITNYCISNNNILPGINPIFRAEGEGNQKINSTIGIPYSYNTSAYEHYYYDNSRLHLFLDNSRLNGMTLVQYLNKYPMEVVYLLENPVVTVLEDETIPTVLKCYEEGSLIFNSSKELSLHPKVEYKIPSYNYFETPLLQSGTYRILGGNTDSVDVKVNGNTVVNSINNYPMTLSGITQNDINIVKVESTGKVRNLQIIKTTDYVNRGIEGITSIGDEGYFDIIVHGSNMFNINKLEAYYDYPDEGNTSSFTVKNGRLEIKRIYGVDYGTIFKPIYRDHTTTCKLSYKVQTGEGKLRLLVNGIPYDTTITEGNTYSHNINPNTDIVFLNTINQSSLVISNIMLNDGETALDYEPYVEDILRVPLENGPLCKLSDDVYDEIEIDPDKMEATIIRKCKKFVIKSEQRLIFAGMYKIDKYYRLIAPADGIFGEKVIDKNNYGSESICNKLQHSIGFDLKQPGYYIDGNLVIRQIGSSGDEALDNLFMNGDLIFICKLANPTYETVKLTKPHDYLHEEGHIIASSDGIAPIVEITTK